MSRSLSIRRARTDVAKPGPPRVLSVSEFVQVTRQNIVHGEYLAALAELARPTPCDGCELFERCKVKRLACNAFVAFVHRGGRAWQNLKTGNPTRALYDLAISQDEVTSLQHRGSPLEWQPVVWADSPLTRDQTKKLARAKAKYIGRAVGNGWRCTGVELVEKTRNGKTAPIVVLLLYHAAERVYVTRTLRDLQCISAPPPPSSAYTRGQVRASGIATVRQLLDERAAIKAASAAADARMHDPEQWKPWTPPCAP